jgi:hypothetical protein
VPTLDPVVSDETVFRSWRKLHLNRRWASWNTGWANSAQPLENACVGAGCARSEVDFDQSAKLDLAG